jgi:1-deoxy-D-xylulose-5-phosphate synthase
MDPAPAKIPIGQAEVLTTGDDLLILAIGSMVSEAMDACDALADQGIQSTVVNCRFVKPLDADQLIRLGHYFSRIITVEENVLQGGFGSAVLELLGDHGALPSHIRRIGIPDRFVEHGAPSILRSKYGLNAENIIATALELFSRTDTSDEQMRRTAHAAVK